MSGIDVSDEASRQDPDAHSHALALGAEGAGQPEDPLQAMRMYAAAVHAEAHARFGCCIWQVHEQWYTSPERERIWNREAPPQYAKLGNGKQQAGRPRAPEPSAPQQPLPLTPHHI